MAVPAKRLWDPLDEMRHLQQEMDEAFERMLGYRSDQPHALSLRETFRAPLSELEDKGDRFVLNAELPGLNKEDVKIEVDPTSITVHGERKEAREEKKKNYYYSERTYAGYQRRIALPTEIDPDSVEAEYKNGILSVTMKKAHEIQKKEVKVK